MRPVEHALRFLSESPDFMELRSEEGWRLDIRYASENNFVGRNLYGEFRRAFLHVVAGEMLLRAREFLHRARPDLQFVIYDALRPVSIQRILWAAVVGTANEMYIASPERGSLHNYGFAVDLGLVTVAGGGLATEVISSGTALDMGAGYDDFRPVAQPQLEQEHLLRGELTHEQVANRRVLREAMVRAGFVQLPHEWWHFDALSRDQVRARGYRMVE